MDCPICMNGITFLDVSSSVNVVSTLKCEVGLDYKDVGTGVVSRSTDPSIVIQSMKCPICKTDLSYYMEHYTDTQTVSRIKDAIKHYYATGKWRLE